jgi:murein L,D-transpeptidase YcbB/YkuD
LSGHGVHPFVRKHRRPGKALILALFSVSIAACGNRGGVQPKQVDAPALQAEARGPEVRAFYQAREWQAAWDKKSEKVLLDIIAQAPANALKPDLFLKGPLPSGASAREAALTDAALRYASALAHGYADPRKLGATYTIPRPKMNLAQGLAQAIEAGTLAQWFASLPPQTAEYRALSEAHVRLLKQAASSGDHSIPEGKAIKPGHSDRRLPAIIGALQVGGYLSSAQAAQPENGPTIRYSGQAVAAVKALQSDFGMKPDGVIGPDTLEALNSGPADRARQLAIAMERLRWLDRTPPGTRIDVNTATTTLQYWRDGKLVDQRAVVTGEPDKPTPQIQASFKQIVANPYWRIPDSIYKEELAGKGSAYLAANRMQFRDGRLVQLPGPKNSLGLVKFDMDDPQDIYLHDTPAKALFEQPERHRSHGCVRIHNALQFAALLTSQDGVAPQFQKALASGKETYVKLKTEIPVRLLYHTAFFDGGKVQFRPDVYGWDDNVAMALGLVRGRAHKMFKPEGEDIGP